MSPETEMEPANHANHTNEEFQHSRHSGDWLPIVLRIPDPSFP